MSNILVIFGVGGVLVLAAIALIIVTVIQEFRVSLMRGMIALIAPILLATGLVMIFIASDLMALENVKAEAANKQGQAEADKQIEQLNNVSPDDMQLDL